MSRQITILRNLYARLGISRTSTQSEIKSAYYKLSKECHPDRNSGCAKATQQFREITEAYDVLGNEASRREYDICAPNDGRVPTTHRAEHTRTEHTRSTYEYSKRDRDLEEMIRSYGRVRRPNWTRNPQQARVRESNGSDEPRDGQFDRPLHRYSKEFEFKNVYVHPTERGKRPLGQEKRNENITNVVFWSTLFLIVTVCILRFK